MTVQIKVLFDTPQREIASRIRNQIAACESVSLIAGFATAEGLDQISAPIDAAPQKLSHLVVGAGTFRAFEALDDLIALGVARERLRVHLGMSKKTGGRRNPFARYRPMLHSKVYLLDMGGGQAVAFVGSHNLTGFALVGLNGEASIELAGDARDPAFRDLQRHVDTAVAQASVYQSWMKDAYAWWTAQFLDGLRVEVNDQPRDSEARVTLIVLAAIESDQIPKPTDVIYFELPDELAIDTLTAQVHVYLFDILPTSPFEALDGLEKARARYRCVPQGIDKGRGGVELLADWYIDDRKQPVMKRTRPPFRPKTQRGMEQVRIQVTGDLDTVFAYEFDTDKVAWEPELDETEGIKPVGANLGRPRKHKRMAPEEGPWFAVRDLKPRAADIASSKQLALIEASPSSGSFVMLSPRRRAR